MFSASPYYIIPPVISYNLAFYAAASPAFVLGCSILNMCVETAVNSFCPCIKKEWQKILISLAISTLAISQLNVSSNQMIKYSSILLVAMTIRSLVFGIFPFLFKRLKSIFQKNSAKPDTDPSKNQVQTKAGESSPSKTSEIQPNPALSIDPNLSNQRGSHNSLVTAAPSTPGTAVSSTSATSVTSKSETPSPPKPGTPASQSGKSNPSTPKTPSCMKGTNPKKLREVKFG